MGKCAVCLKQILRGTGPFFQVPADDQKRLLWQTNCRVQLRPKDFICADHFSRDDMICGGKKARLLPKAIPYPPLLSVVDTNCAPVAQPNLGSELCFIESNQNLQDCVAEPMSIGVNSSSGAVILDVQILTASSETQTDCVIFDALMEPEILSLKREVSRLKQENKDLQRKLNESKTVLDNFRHIFTDGQMRKMIAPEKNIQWHWKDISSAICLNAAGPRAYSHLYDKGFPLPHVSTLNRWSRKTDMSEGLLAASFQALEDMSEVSNDDKICVLSFDEMKVAEAYEYDQLGGHVQKPVRNVQVVMARGLLKSWKQPVFYAFDTPMTRDILCSIIIALKNINFQVVAVVSDMGSTNRNLWWRSLKVTIDEPWFAHPSDDSAKVFVFADVPHLLKLVRNHYLDHNIIWKNHLLTTRTICDLLNHTSSSDVSIAHKISYENLEVNQSARQKVKTAARLFSNSVASALRRCHSVGYELYKPLETADFIQLVNDWFDVLNSSMGTFAYPGKEPFGRDLPNQLDILNRMNEFMSSPILPGKKSIELFQKGILMTNRALVGLYNELKLKSNVEYILTNRLNQDVLENFFGAMRSKGGLNDHPTPMDFQYRLRKYILARNTQSLRPTGNVLKDSTEWVPQGTSTPFKPSGRANLNVSVVDTINGSKREFTGPIGSEQNKENHDHGDEEDSDMINSLDSSYPDDCGVLKEDALAYISGYMIKKLKLDEFRDLRPSIGFVDQVSKGFLKKPSPPLMHGVKIMEKIFERINGSEISDCKNLHQRLVSSSANVQLPENVKRLFFKCRIHFRVRSLNKRLKVQKAKAKLMGLKKFLKIKL